MAPKWLTTKTIKNSSSEYCQIVKLQTLQYFMCAMPAITQYFLKKIMCCVSKNNVLWQTCHNTLFFQKILCCGHGAQHNIFWKQ